MSRELTKPELFYMGTGGDDWLTRCKSSKYLKQNIALFTKIIESTVNVNSILEFGTGAGNDFIALNYLIQQPKFAGIEINTLACEEIKKTFPDIDIHNISALNYEVVKQYDLVLSKGFLVHIVEECLPKIYQKMYDSSNRYICIVEYYNPTPTEIKWRNNDGVMFKRDFCGELLERYPNLQLVNYGFVYHRDSNFPQDDFNWFLLEKK